MSHFYAPRKHQKNLLLALNKLIQYLSVQVNSKKDVIIKHTMLKRLTKYNLARKFFAPHVNKSAFLYYVKVMKESMSLSSEVNVKQNDYEQ